MQVNNKDSEEFKLRKEYGNRAMRAISRPALTCTHNDARLIGTGISAISLIGEQIDCLCCLIAVLSS